MSRYTMSAACAEPGCNERGYFAADTRKEQREHYARQQKKPWKCTRHAHPDEVLSREAPVLERVLVSYETDHGFPQYGVKRFWTTPEMAAEKKGGSGFAYGPGFKAFADDFPTGTRIVVTTRLELPAASPSKEETNA